MDDYELQLTQAVSEFSVDPTGYANFAFPWGEPGTKLEKHSGPREWQTNILNDIKNHLQDPVTRYQPCQIAVASGHGIGKMITLQNDMQKAILDPLNRKEVIAMQHIKWGELKPGDHVLGSDGVPTEILATKNFVRPCYKVTFDDGSSVVCGAEHEWNVRGRNERRKKLDTWRTLETKEILANGVLRANGNNKAKQWEIPIQGVAQFSHKTVYDAYTVGVWLGDGSSSSGKISSSRQELWDKIGKQPNKDTLRYLKDGSMSASPDGLEVALKNYSMQPVTSDTKFIADDYKYNSEDVRRALVSGMLDSDGEVHSSGSIGYSSTSKRLVEDLIWMVRSLGGKAMMQPKPKKTFYVKDGVRSSECKPCYRCTINFGGWNPFTHTYKKSVLKTDIQHRYLCRWIESIEPVGEMEGMCIEVAAEDHLYQTNDFIVTHNSALIGMITKWGLDTCDNTRIICTSNTDTQLKTKTVPEVTKWVREAITENWFTATATAIYSNENNCTKSWRCDFVPWSKDNSEAFAGLHNEGKRIIVIFDEASGIDDVIWEVTEGALSDANTEIIWLAFGNPTRNTGRFRECFRRFKKYWKTYSIDSRTVEGTNTALFDRLVEQYGEDSDIVKIRVKGQFPSQSAKQFFNEKKLDQSRAKHLRDEQFNFAPKIISVDPAWEGDDDLVIGMRQGLHFQILRVLPKNDNDIEVAQIIRTIEDEEKADAVFIDGGYGTGIVSAGRTMKRKWQLVWFSGKSGRIDCFNKRSEMYVDAAEWINEGGAIPDDQQLYDELVMLETIPTIDGKYRMPDKKLIKKELGVSPNHADCLAISFAYPVAKRAPTGLQSRSRKKSQSYNPIKDRLK